MTSIGSLRASGTIRIAIPSGQRGLVANGVVLCGLTLACALVDLALLPFAEITLSTEGFVYINPLIAVALLPVSAFYTFVRYDRIIASVTGAFAILIVVTPLLCLLTYLAAALGHDVPLRDAMLARVDAAIGFDWPTMLRWADAHPGLVHLCCLAYQSIAVQAAMMVLLLAAVGQTERLQVAIYTYIVSAVACGTISALVPALGTYTYFGIDPSQFTHIELTTRDTHVADVMALRSGAFTEYGINSAKGIITFPSFHATLGVLFSWAFWQVRWLRWVALALNAALIVATPLQGSHYLADVLAGFVVAAGAIALAGALHRKVGSIATRTTASRPIGTIRFR